MIENTAKRLDAERTLNAARKFTLYHRASAWYVHCMDPETGKSVRISTGHADRELAEAYVARCRQPAHFAGGDAETIWTRLGRARVRARKKGLPFRLGITDIRKLIERSGGRCEVSGVPFTAKGAFQPSIDRVNPALGYVPENVRLVCLITNTAMLHYGEAAFRELALAYVQKHALV